MTSHPTLHLTLLALALSLFLSRPAHAYLDAGTGSLILQTILGGVAGLAILFKLYWEKLFTFLGIRKKKDEEEPSRQ
jgi:hypothetical protein